MQKVLKFAGVTVGAGAVIGFSVVGWLYAHRLDGPDAVAARSAVAKQLSTPGTTNSNGFSGLATGSSGLSITNSGDQGLSSLIQSNNSTPTPTPNPNTLPGPSGFGVYNQYINDPTSLYIDVKAGSGGAVASGSQVTVQYRAYLTNGTEFDDTYATGKPFVFTEGNTSLITGFEDGVLGMKVGGERRLIIPPAQGYGANAQGAVPANSVLVFDVVLVSVQ